MGRVAFASLEVWWTEHPCDLSLLPEEHPELLALLGLLRLGVLDFGPCLFDAVGELNPFLDEGHVLPEVVHTHRRHLDFLLPALLLLP